MQTSLIVKVVVALCLILSPFNAYATGDCDNSGEVTIAEVHHAINMFLDANHVTSCVDEDSSGTVSVDEVQKTINTFLDQMQVNISPIANAGIAQNVITGAVVTLDGSGSSDANGDALTYQWDITSRPSGSVATLVKSTVIKPTFVPDVDGVYLISLVVNDGKVDSPISLVELVSTSDTGSISIGVTF